MFTTPDVFPPAIAPTDDIDDDSDADPTADAGGERPTTLDPRHCYVCKQHYTEIDAFYDQLCPSCAAFNFAKRSETADLTGRVALLTGGRVKIGSQAGIKLLRAAPR